VHRRHLLLAGACALLLACVADGSRAAPAPPPRPKPKDLLVGKWTAVQEGPGGQKLEVSVEFTPDGKLSVSAGPIGLSGSYKWLDDKNIEVEVAGNKEKNEVVSVTGEKLTLKDPKGKVETFTRVGRAPAEGPRPPDRASRRLLPGKWSASQPTPDGKKLEVVVEFTDAGEVTASVLGTKIAGSYRWTDDRHIEVEIGGKKETTEVVSLTKDRLTLKDPQGKTEEFTRVK
jgi:uncharacterized protein (TIGR03066 family)